MSAGAINKTMQRDDLRRPECQAVLEELFGLMRRMRAKDAHYSSWYGAVDAWPCAWEHINRGESYQSWPGNPDELRVPWFLLWQIAWLTANTPMSAGSRVLDMGGAGSLFSCHLASRGFDVFTIDLQEGLCSLSKQTARVMGWRITAKPMDMRRLDFPPDFFDHVFSVSVLEHLPVSGRIECNKEVMRVLKPGGLSAYTFDYANPQSFGRIDSPEDVRRQFVEDSGLRVRGNAEFVDTGDRYLDSPQCFGFGRFTRLASSAHALLSGTVAPGRVFNGTTSYTMGALFLEKPVETA